MPAQPATSRPKLATPKAKALNQLEETLAHALDLVEQLPQSPHADDRQNKLTAAAFLAGALKNAKFSIEQCRELRAELDADAVLGDDSPYPSLHALRAAAFKGAAATRNDKGMNADPCLGGLNSLMGIRGAEFAAEVIPQCMMLGTVPLKVYAVGVLDATEQHPEAFGVIQDRAALAKLHADIEAAKAAIGAAISLDTDAVFRIEDSKTGNGRLYLKRWPAVVVGGEDDRATLGQRLIEHFQSRR